MHPNFRHIIMGGWPLELMKHGIPATVNSDNIEESGFQLERCILFLSSLPHWLHCNILSLHSVVGLFRGTSV